MSLVMEASSGKSYVMNLLDTPGEPPPQAMANLPTLPRQAWPLPAQRCRGRGPPLGPAAPLLAPSRCKASLACCTQRVRRHLAGHPASALWLPGPSFLFLVVDNPDPVLPLPDAPCPGHVNFSDELSASLRLSDGVLLVVDAVEGVMVGTERAIKAAAAEGLPICLLISKVDRRGRGKGLGGVPGFALVSRAPCLRWGTALERLATALGAT